MIKILMTLSLMALFSCRQPEDANKTVLVQQQTDTAAEKPIISQRTKKRLAITYRIENAKEWLLERHADSIQEIGFALNRTDRSNFSRMDSVIIPSDLSLNIADYLSFPLKVDFLSDVNKIIYFSYPTQTFAAYENGILVHTGPTNMGKESQLTPTGLFFTNWKAKVTRSTINAGWILNWNFNILNKEGIGWHQFSLPGYPASHSCLRLREKDAKFLYYWADQWVLKNTYTISVKGTPVIIFGTYDFSSPKPWFKMVSDPQSLDITVHEIEKITQPYFNEILSSQQRRDSLKMVNKEIVY